MLACEPIGHPSDVADCGTKGSCAACVDMSHIYTFAENGCCGGLGECMRSVGVVLYQRPKESDDGVTLALAGWTHINVLVVELVERRERLGDVGRHTDLTRCCGRRHHRPDKRTQLSRTIAAASLGNNRRQHLLGHDSGSNSIFEVVADVGDPVSP